MALLASCNQSKCLNCKQHDGHNIFRQEKINSKCDENSYFLLRLSAFWFSNCMYLGKSHKKYRKRTLRANSNGPTYYLFQQVLRDLQLTALCNDSETTSKRVFPTLAKNCDQLMVKRRTFIFVPKTSFLGLSDSRFKILFLIRWFELKEHNRPEHQNGRVLLLWKNIL